eukprot:768066-Hanusia_phi.AAC.2
MSHTPNWHLRARNIHAQSPPPSSRWYLRSVCRFNLCYLQQRAQESLVRRKQGVLVNDVGREDENDDKEEEQEEQEEQEQEQEQEGVEEEEGEGEGEGEGEESITYLSLPSYRPVIPQGISVQSGNNGDDSGGRGYGVDGSYLATTFVQNAPNQIILDGSPPPLTLSLPPSLPPSFPLALYFPPTPLSTPSSSCSILLSPQLLISLASSRLSSSHLPSPLPLPSSLSFSFLLSSTHPSLQLVRMKHDEARPFQKKVRTANCAADQKAETLGERSSCM